eukprot:NODE_8524_length_1489_cov_6.708517.p1 GENE.NODE_8524_length_1489_cov_6.708517~~NODE_8524_length_1489_cov_6.708517.p1  ORF type:complete len:442 (-),score=97.24 NODE_8524_length_1489_cov_6.708517:162-1463(-)
MVPTVFETTNHIAGIWAVGSPLLYPTLHSNVLGSLMTFGDFPPSSKSAPGGFLHHMDLSAHVLAFAEKFGLMEYVELGSRVEAVSRLKATETCPEGWVVQVNGKKRCFRRVCLCTGAVQQPHVPDIPIDAVTRTFHSSTFGACNTADFAGKHVVVVGFGNSACDITECVTGHAASVTIIVRKPLRVCRKADVRNFNGLYLLPLKALMMAVRHITTVIPCGTDTSGEDLKLVASNNLLDLLAAGHVTVRLGELVECRGGRARFKDGTEIAADVIAWCTGYQPSDFGVAEPQLRAKLLAAPLYQHVWHPDYTDLAVVGNGGGLWYQLGAQAVWVARVWSGRVPGPDLEFMHKWIAMLKEGRQDRDRWTREEWDAVPVFIGVAKQAGLWFTPLEALCGFLRPFKPHTFLKSAKQLRKCVVPNLRVELLGSSPAPVR